jgi:glycosyltransferase involved in cell wall biosynthesis
VRAPVTYLTAEDLKPSLLWAAIEEAGCWMPDLWQKLEAARGTEVRELYRALRLAVEARRRGLGHLHAHFATVATTVARLAAAFSGVSYSFTAHAKDIFHESVRTDELRRKIDEAEAAVTVSEFNLEYLRGLFGPAAVKVERIYNGLDLEQFQFQAPERRPPEIAGVGRLVEKKGFGDLIEACSILASSGRRFHCAIIGEGPLELDLRRQVEKLGLQGIVELAGPRPQIEVKQLVQSAAVCAAPCVLGSDGNRDGLPTVLIEAMALGTPCIATDVTGIPEVLIDGETGLLVRQNDPGMLAAAIERLLEDSELRVRLASRSRRLVESNFDIHKNAAQLRRIFAAGQRAATRRMQEVA